MNGKTINRMQKLWLLGAIIDAEEYQSTLILDCFEIPKDI